MGRIQHSVRLCGEKVCKEEKGLFDTGSDYTYLSPKLARQLDAKFTGFEFETEVADKRTMSTREAELEEIEILGCKRIKPRVMVADIGTDLIVGNDIMQLLGIRLDPKNHKIRVDKCRSSVILYLSD